VEQEGESSSAQERSSLLTRTVRALLPHQESPYFSVVTGKPYIKLLHCIFKLQQRILRTLYIRNFPQKTILSFAHISFYSFIIFCYNKQNGRQYRRIFYWIR